MERIIKEAEWNALGTDELQVRESPWKVEREHLVETVRLPCLVNPVIQTLFGTMKTPVVPED